MSRKINIYKTVNNVIDKWPHDSDDAVVGLHRKDENGFIDCRELFYEDEFESIYDDEELFKKRIDNALNNNGLYLAIAFGEGEEECDYGITIDKDFNMRFAKRYYGSFVSGQYCEIAFEEFDAEELILNYLSTIRYD